MNARVGRPRRLVGIGHKARRGKGAVGAWLVENRGFVERNFAAALYDECRELFGMEGKDAWLLQSWAEDRRQNCGADYWVKRLQQWTSQNSDDVVITDVRYPNEAEWIREHGGLLWRVDRDEPLEDIARDPDHISERALDDWDDWDAVIPNEGSLLELRQKVHAIAVQQLDSL